MILSAETTLRAIAHVLRERIAPSVQDKFAAESLRLAEMLLSLNAGWIDDAAAIRVAENAAIRSIFADAAMVIADAALADRVALAAASSDPGVRISELDTESNRLRTLLVEVHAHIDTIESEGTRQFSHRIWRALADFEAARAPR